MKKSTNTVDALALFLIWAISSEALKKAINIDSLKTTQESKYYTFGALLEMPQGCQDKTALVVGATNLSLSCCQGLLGLEKLGLKNRVVELLLKK